MAQRFDVLSPRTKRDGGTHWHKVGSAWQGEKGINIVFDSLPLPDAEGRVSVSLFEPREQSGQQSGGERSQQQRRQSSGGGYRDDLDSEIPF